MFSSSGVSESCWDIIAGPVADSVNRYMVALGVANLGGSQFGASKQKVSLSFSQGRCERFHLNGDFDCLGLGDTQHCILADFLAVLVLPPEAAEWRSFVE